MANKEKLFAFTVVAKETKNQARKEDVKWAAREGVAAAGCTDYRFVGNVRYPHATWGADRGVYC